MEELEKHLIEIMNKTNHEPIDVFEGYSSTEMHFILYHTFSAESPIKIVEAQPSIYQRIPIFQQVKYLLNFIHQQKELKLTKKGFLPTNIVAELYGQGFLKDEYIERGLYKLYKESDVPTINLTRILLELSSLVKKRNNKLSLTKKGTQQLDNNHFLFKHIFEIFTKKFNWAYFDGFTNELIGQFGFGFTLILIDKYGVEYRDLDFYADKYFSTFDFQTNAPEPWYGDKSERAYKLRTFERFLDYFGFTTYDEAEKNPKVKKSEIFNEIIHIRPHQNY